MLIRVRFGLQSLRGKGQRLEVVDHIGNQTLRFKRAFSADLTEMTSKFGTPKLEGRSEVRVGIEQYRFLIYSMLMKVVQVEMFRVYWSSGLIPLFLG